MAVDTDRISITLRAFEETQHIDEEINVEFGVTNFTGNEAAEVQLIMRIPNGLSIRGLSDVQSGQGEYSSHFKIDPGESTGASYTLEAYSPGHYEIDGRVVYLFPQDDGDNRIHDFVLPVRFTE